MKHKPPLAGPISYLAVFNHPLTPAMRAAFWAAARPKPWWLRLWRWLRRFA